MLVENTFQLPREILFTLKKIYFWFRISLVSPYLANWQHCQPLNGKIFFSTALSGILFQCWWKILFQLPREILFQLPGKIHFWLRTSLVSLCLANWQHCQLSAKRILFSSNNTQHTINISCSGCTTLHMLDWWKLVSIAKTHDWHW